MRFVKIQYGFVLCSANHDRNPIQHRIARQWIDFTLVCQDVGIDSGVFAGDVHVCSGQAVAPAVRDAQDAGPHRVRDLGRDVDGPRPWGDAPRLPAGHAQARRVAGVPVRGAALLAPAGRLDVVPPRVVPAHAAAAA